MPFKTSERETILIVDDTPANLNILFDYLDSAGFKVLVASSGSEALERAKYMQPDLILLDVMMPGMDGFETCRRLKREEITEDIPIIFMTALADAESKITGFDVGGVDYITKPFHNKEVLARVNTHLTIRRIQKDLQARNRELDAFAHTVAHDIRNSLNRIMGFAEMLSEEYNTISADELKKYSDIITRSGRQMSQLVEALLLLAGVRKQEVELTPLDMSDIVDGALHRLSDMIDRYQAEIILPQAWPTAMGYAPWVEEVWVNYLDNALKYGGQPPCLELGAALQPDGQLRFLVQDNGPGIAPENQARLFTEFTRLEPSRSEGHGLGLSIVKRIVERLSGQVGVESRLGQGGLFYFTLEKAPAKRTES